ncbi:hypothetical protein ACKJUK_004236 [Cronobacter turicensis]
MEVIRLNLSSRLDVVIRKTAVLLPADVILLIVGWVAPGGVAVEAGKNCMILP